MRSSLIVAIFTTLAALNPAGAQTKASVPPKKAPSPTKPPAVAKPAAAPVERATPPAEHTAVLAFIEPNDPSCHTKELTSADKDAGISKRLIYSVTKPDRTFYVTANTKGDPLAFSGTVSWGTNLPTEKETADATFDSAGGVIKAVKFLGFAGKKGAGASYPLSADEIAKVRDLTTEILKRCSQ